MSRIKITSLIAALGVIFAACGGGTAETTTSEAPDVATTAAPTTTQAPAATTAAPETTTVAPTTTAAPSTTSAPAAVTAELAAFRAAVSETTEVTSAQMEGAIVVTGAEDLGTDEPVAVVFSGAFDNDTGDFAFSVDLSGFMAAADDAEIPPEFADLMTAIEMRQIGDTAYVRMAFLSMFLGAETDWLSMPAEDADSMGDFTGGFVPATQTDILEVFERVDATVEDLGPDEVRDVATTHYRVTVDVAALVEAGDEEALEALELSGPVPLDELAVDFWIGADDLVYRFVMEIDGDDVETEPGEGFETMSLTFETFGYNEPINIEAPDPADVTDVEDLDFGGFFEGF